MRASLHRVVPVMVCLGLGLGGPAASAQPAPAPPAASSAAAPSTSAADALFEEGQALLKANDFEAACAKLEASLKLNRAFWTLFNLARCEEGRKRFGTAARRYKEGLALLPADDANRARAQGLLDGADKQAGHLLLRLPADAPPDTRVTLDDQPVAPGDLATAIAVDAGARRIVVAAPGHEPRTFAVTVTVGATGEVALTMGPAIAPVGTSPGEPGPAPPPSVAVSVQPRATVPPAPMVPPASRWSISQHKTSFTLLGGGVVLAGAGAAVAADIVLGRYSSFVQKCVGATGCTAEDKSGMANQALAVNLLFGAAIAAGVAAVGVYVFAEPDQSPTAPPQLQIAVGPTGATVGVEF